MIFLAYIISIIIFGVANIIGGGIALSIATRIGVQMGFTSSTAQFIGAFVGCALGAFVAPYVFGWFHKSPDLIILFVVLEIVWLITNSTIAPEHSPFAQRVGATVGLIVVFVVLSI